MPNILPSSLPSGAEFRFGSHTDSPDMWDERNSRDTPTPHSFSALPRPSHENDSQPAMSHGSQSELQVDANANLGTSPFEDYIFPTLREYHGPIVAVINQHDTRQILQLPTLLSRRNIHRNISVMARRTHCIRNGGEAFSRPDFENMKVATRRLQRDIFPRELNLLDELLVNVVKNLALDTSEERSGLMKPVYRLWLEDYRLLLAYLYRQRQVANDGFLILGSSGSVSEWHNENDFEIIVENFLWQLDQAFDYEGQQAPRSIADTLTEESLAIAQRPAHGTHLRHSRPLQQSSSARTAIQSIQQSPVAHPLIHVSTPHHRVEAHSVESTTLEEQTRRFKGPANPGTTHLGLIPPHSSSSHQVILGPESPSISRNPFRTGNLYRGFASSMLSPRQGGGHMNPGNDGDGSSSGSSNSGRPPQYPPRNPRERGNNNPRPGANGPPDNGGNGFPGGGGGSGGPNGWPGGSAGDPTPNGAGHPGGHGGNLPGGRGGNPGGGGGDDSGPVQPIQAFNNNPFLYNYEPQFNWRLKYDTVPTWDGDADTIMRWLAKINDMARESWLVYTQLGRVVPKRLKGNAEIWYWSLPLDYRSEIEQHVCHLVIHSHGSILRVMVLSQRWLPKIGAVNDSQFGIVYILEGFTRYSCSVTLEVKTGVDYPSLSTQLSS
ncbi:hypothetical protein C8R43DRAFT_1191946 [Mycena crocata]|nr:hypothetical protein C8R43DRAFT_1191946 [Mycena crocata]